MYPEKGLPEELALSYKMAEEFDSVFEKGIEADVIDSPTISGVTQQLLILGISGSELVPNGYSTYIEREIVTTEDEDSVFPEGSLLSSNHKLVILDPTRSAEGTITYYASGVDIMRQSFINNDVNQLATMALTQKQGRELIDLINSGTSLAVPDISIN